MELFAPSGMSRRAFTLIELLVVTAIITLLLAILMPVLYAARAAARTNSCAAQQWQIATAILMYAQDFDERLPRTSYPQEVYAGIWPDWHEPSPDSPTGGWCYTGWDRKIQPYIRSRAVFICPDDSYILSGVDAWGQPRLPRDDTSYGFNAAACFEAALSDFEAPSQTIMLAETKSWHRADYPKAAGDPREVDDPADLFMCDVERHRAGANYTFVDGHVKWLRPAQTLAPVNLWRRTK